MAESVKCPIAEQAGIRPEAPALIDGVRGLTYAEVHTRAAKTALNLSRLGLGRGDRAAVLSSNSIEYAVLIFALQRIGASAVLLSLHRTAESWKLQLQESRVKSLFADKQHLELCAELEGLSNIIGIDSVCAKRGGNALEVETNFQPLRLADETTIIYTSGTSSEGKGVILTLGNHLSAASASNSLTGLCPGDTWLLCLPLFHVAGLEILYRSAVAGACSFLLSSFSALDIAAALRAHKISHLSLVPTQLEHLLGASDNVPLSGLKTILLGGAPAGKELLKKIRTGSIPVQVCYGMTETTSHITLKKISKDTSAETLNKAGCVHSKASIRIMDINGRECLPGDSGEVQVRGEVVFKSYVNKALNNDKFIMGWYRTGDLGYLDNAGELMIEGRLDDMLISGGVNIYPLEIEALAAEFPGVCSAAVIAVANDKFGKRPVLFVESDEGVDIDTRALSEYLRTRLGPIRTPDEVLHIARIPRGPLGKVLKDELAGDFFKRAIVND